MPLSIGFDVPFEPFGLLIDGRPAGLLVELVSAVLTRAEHPHSFLTMPLAETEAALFSGRVDALAFKGVTPERNATMDFSAPLIVSGAALFTRLGTAIPTNPATLAGQRVVTPRKGPLWAALTRLEPPLVMVDGDSYEGSFDALRDGRADAAALNLHAGLAIAQRLHPGAFTLPAGSYTPLPIAFAVAKGRHTKLLADFDQKTFVQSGLLPGIPHGTVVNVSLNERMKDERQHFGGYDRTSGRGLVCPCG